LYTTEGKQTLIRQCIIARTGIEHIVILTTSQKNHLRASLRMFEDALHLTDSILTRGNEKGIFYERTLDLDATQIATAKEKVGQALAALEALARECDLEVHHEDLNRTVIGHLSVCWADLIDANSKKLRDYGKVDPSVAAVLDPAVTNLSQLAMELSRIFKAPSQETSSFENEPE
jgi:hypothetical protein